MVTRTELTLIIPYTRLSGCDLFNLKLLCVVCQSFEVKKKKKAHNGLLAVNLKHCPSLIDLSS